ncbi:MAG: peroxiredoxin-like family protein [Gammaproteobacteria bacterium]|nr:MAG: peroxiredoxin-like family protein [Gammaproteobacteria bacterium]
MNQTTLNMQTQQALQDFVSALPEDQQKTISSAFEELMSSNVAADAKTTGDKAPDFELSNVRGDTLNIRDALAEGPVVLSFYRGSWCPFCNLELNALQQQLPAIHECGARLIAVSPEKPDSSLTHAEKLNLEFDVLSDAGNRVAGAYGLIMTVPESMRPLYLQWGIDLPAANGDDSHQLPVPATYVIDRNGIIQAAHVDKDYTKRMEPEAIVAALKALG